MWGAVSKRPAWGSKLLGLRPLAFVGRISYSMYLYHLPLLLLFNKYAPSLGWLAFPCYFTLLAGVSALSFRLIERPFMQAPRRLTGAAANLAPR
jgi:peptidoglycan/LPS O-acetylase OafA/YrhL